MLVGTLGKSRVVDRLVKEGRLKPGEVGTEFFLDHACDPQRWRHDNIRAFLEQWAARELDARFAPEIAAIMEEHFQLVLYPVQCAALMNEKVISADQSTRLAARGQASAAEYARKARAAAARIVELTDRYNTGLITVSNKWNHTMSAAPGPWGNQRHQFERPPLRDFAGQGPALLDIAAEGGREDAVPDLSVYTQGRRFIDLFNQGTGAIEWQATVSEPWVKLDQTHGRFTGEQRLWVRIDWDRVPKGRDVQAAVEIASDSGHRRIVVPVFNPDTPARSAVTGFVQSHGYVSMEAEHFTRRQDRGGAGWEVLGGLGRSGDSVSVLPPTVPSRTQPADIAANSPSLEYDLYLFDAGEARLDIDCLPAKPVTPRRGTRVAVSLDDGTPEILNGPGGDVLANLRRVTTKMRIPSPGPHRVIVWMVDPGVVLDKLVLDFRPPVESYYAVEQSIHPLGSGRPGALVGSGRPPSRSLRHSWPPICADGRWRASRTPAYPPTAKNSHPPKLAMPTPKDFSRTRRAFVAVTPILSRESGALVGGLGGPICPAGVGRSGH